MKEKTPLRHNYNISVWLAPEKADKHPTLTLHKKALYDDIILRELDGLIFRHANNFEKYILHFDVMLTEQNCQDLINTLSQDDDIINYTCTPDVRVKPAKSVVDVFNLIFGIDEDNK